MQQEVEHARAAVPYEQGDSNTQVCLKPGDLQVMSLNGTLYTVAKQQAPIAHAHNTRQAQEAAAHSVMNTACVGTHRTLFAYRAPLALPQNSRRADT